MRWASPPASVADDRFSATVDGMPYDNIFVFENIGYNFEPSEIGAAYGCVQLDKLKEFNSRRQYAFHRYDDWFATQDRFMRPRTTAELETTWMLYPFVIEEEAGFTRTDAQTFLDEQDFLERHAEVPPEVGRPVLILGSDTEHHVMKSRDRHGRIVDGQGRCWLLAIEPAEDSEIVPN